MEHPATAPARGLVIYDGPGVEDFFDEVGQKATERTLLRSESLPGFDTVVAAGERHGLEIERLAS